MQKIAILGSRGIPASYGGFETSVEETSIRFVRKKYSVTVFCRKNYYKKRMTSYKNVKLVYLPSIKTKYLDTITHSFLSVIKSIIERYDIIILYGIGNCILLPLYKLFSIPVISVVDGADWERKKWGKFARLYLRFNRNIAVKYSSFYVVDNELLSDDYSKKFKKPSVYIPYGAKTEVNPDISVLNKYKLKEKGYIIFVGRFVKEKGIEFLINNYMKIETDKKLVIVGGNAIDKGYEQELKSIGGKRAIFPGFVYGNEYESLLKFAYLYVSCSYLEGTSPSLLSAMAVNGFALVSDLAENKEVLKGTCAIFKTGDHQDFREKLYYYLKNSELVEKERFKTNKIIDNFYNWDRISQAYIELFKKIKLKSGPKI